jgi:hypothetical protein
MIHNPTIEIQKLTKLIRIPHNLQAPNGQNWVSAFRLNPEREAIFKGYEAHWDGTPAGTLQMKAVLKREGFNILMNPGLEDGQANWYLSGEAEVSEAEKRSGTKSAHIPNTAGAGGFRSHHILVAPNTLYKFGGYVKGTGVSVTRLNLRWFSDVDASNMISEQSIYLDGTYSDWTLISGEQTVPTDAVSVDLCFENWTAGASDIYGDDFYIKEGELIIYPKDGVENLESDTMKETEIFIPKGETLEILWRSDNASESAWVKWKEIVFELLEEPT